MTKNIEEFLHKRRENKLKEKLKGIQSETEIETIQQKIITEFSPNIWLEGAAKRAAWLSITSHPGKFSHPSAVISAIICENNKADDGYIRSGNIDAPLDVFGNAAALDVYSFLQIILSNGETVLSHLENNTFLIQNYLSQHFLLPEKQEKIRLAFLAIKQGTQKTKTSTLIKQIYFPLADGYHLLSILTPSGIVSTLKKRIDLIKFSEKSKQIRNLRRKNVYSEEGLYELYHLTQMGCMSSKPQNISDLNKQNNGKIYLLNSCPPILKKRKVRLPTRDFFTQSLKVNRFTDAFITLNKLIHIDDKHKNHHVRQAIINVLNYIIEQIIWSAAKIRQYQTGWTQTEYYQKLPLHQKIWLDNHYQEKGNHYTDWQDEVVAELSRWLLNTFSLWSKKTNNQEVVFGSAAYLLLSKLTQETFTQNREYL